VAARRRQVYALKIGIAPSEIVGPVSPWLVSSRRHRATHASPSQNIWADRPGEGRTGGARELTLGSIESSLS